jgi:hypothetical protein
MPKFTITETVPCTQVWTYDVEAATESEALEMVLNGKAEVAYSSVMEHDFEVAQFEIEENKNSNTELIDDINKALKDGFDDYDGAAWDMQAK